jgi:hypothetical protein
MIIHSAINGDEVPPVSNMSAPVTIHSKRKTANELQKMYFFGAQKYRTMLVASDVPARIADVSETSKAALMLLTSAKYAQK